MTSSTALLLFLLQVPQSVPGMGEPPAWDNLRLKKAAQLAVDWWKARPKTRFAAWDQTRRTALVKRARALGSVPEGHFEELVKLFWRPVKRYGPRAAGHGKQVIETPYGKAWFLRKGHGSKGLVIGLHGGGVGAGSASEAAGRWVARGLLGMYPQGIRLQHDTWNTVHGERFVLTLMEIAKARDQVDPDRIYVMGFSMGGTGSWFMAGRHPDWLAGASPCAGVLMAAPKSQLPRKEDIRMLQPGMVPNVRNLAMYYYIGLADDHCMPGTYLYAWDLLQELKREDPGGYRRIRFRTYPGLTHRFPPGEPARGIRWLTKQRRAAFPRMVVWEYASDPRPLPDGQDKVGRLPVHDFYWLRAAHPRDGQVIRASRDGNTITLQVEGTGNGLKGLTIFLNPEMIDVQQPVVVKNEGQIVYQGRPRPDFWTVLDTMDARLDRKLVFDRRIQF